MKILSFQLRKLHNAEHFQFMTEVNKLILLYTVAKLKITRLYSPFIVLYNQEDECIFLLRKSDYTKLMEETDKFRDSIFRGLVNMVNAALNHYDPNIKASARRVKILFDTYGNLAKKTDHEESSGIYNLTKELEEKYQDDMNAINALDWVFELRAKNEEFETLVKYRQDEKLERPETRMKNTRVEIDKVYHDLTGAIEGLGKLAEKPEDMDMYKEFINKLNIIVEEYKNGLAIREGLNEAKKEKEEEARD